MTKTLSCCGQYIREHDPDRFLLSLLAPAEKRGALWALFAFNHEISKTREVVTETQLGLIRLQWWRDEIEKIYDAGHSEAHELLPTLSEAIQTYNLPKEHFEALLYAREFDLEDVLPADVDGLMKYAEYTSLPLYRLCAKVLGERVDDETLKAIAQNYALSGLMLAVPFHAAQRRCFLPQSLVNEHNVPLGPLYDGKPDQAAVGMAVRDVLNKFHSKSGVHSAFLKASEVLAARRMKKIKSLKYNVFDVRMFRPQPLKSVSVLFGVWFYRILNW